MDNTKPLFENSQKNTPIVSFERGKIPPQAIDLEEVVIGAMMIDKKGVDSVIDILHPEVFYKESHQFIFESIVKLFENTEPIDILTVSAKLKIPFYPVPMTMQTFVVLFLGIAFGFKIGLATVSIYLLEGIIGIPVFSNSPEKGVGLAYFTGPTMGLSLIHI